MLDIACWRIKSLCNPGNDTGKHVEIIEELVRERIGWNASRSLSDHYVLTASKNPAYDSTRASEVRPAIATPR